MEQVATDGVSVKLSKKDLLDAKADLKRVEVALLPETATQAGILGELISFFLAFCRRCEQVELTDFDEDTNRYWKVYDGQESLTMINRNFKTELALLHCAWSIINPAEPLMDCQGVNIDVLVGTKRVLENLLMILELLYQGNWAWCYKFVLEEVYEKVDGIDTKQFSFSWWCLSPKVVFKGIGESVHSLILTSGTLAPLKAFGPSLGISFEKTVECLHVINPHQILARKIVHSPSGFQLNGSFKNRETREYKDAIGESILEILRSTSQGALVFMPSYSMMHQMFIRWKETGLYKRLENVRTIFYEPRTSLDEIFMNSYYMSCFDPKPGLLFCIYRGKLSEGIDFANEQARTVICVGIPYPALFDPLVQEKKRCHPKGWYEIQAYRAINQALGRCIRHSKDWGGVYLLDSRISVEMLPKWFRGYLEYATDWSKLSKDIQDFFVLNQTVFCHSCGHGIEISKIVGCVNEMHQFCQSCYQKWFQKEEDNVLTMLQEGDVGLDCLVEDCPFKLSVDQVNELFQSFNLN